MSDAVSAKRLAENEVVFRQTNERVQQRLRKLQAEAKEEGYPDKLLEDSTSLYFYCECSDENCRERIVMKPGLYGSLHKDRAQFIIIPGHSVSSIENIIKSTPNYEVVKKVIAVPKNAKRLHKTDVDDV